MKYVFVLLMLLAAPAFACEACFGAEGHAQTNGMNSAILTLLGVTGGVLLFFAALIARVAWRAVKWNRAQLVAETVR